MIYSVITNAYERENWYVKIKFGFFKKATKIDKISTLNLMFTTTYIVEIFVAFLENLKFTYFFILDWWFLDLNKEEEVIELIFYKGLLDTIYDRTDYLNLLLWIDCLLTHTT